MSIDNDKYKPFKMNTTSVLERDLKVSDDKLNFIIENMPNNGYAVVAGKLNIEDRRIVRNEIVQRKKLYNSQVVNACIELIKFVSGKSPEDYTPNKN